mgnify:CR=1 FL=1
MQCVVSNNNDVAPTISTPNAVGGISVIRISGSDAFVVSDRVFRAYSGKKVTDMDGYTCAYGEISENGEKLDDVVLTVFRAPRSYTGEDVAEISCHGGMYITRQVLRLVLAAGAELAEPGEFTKRAFLNGKMDLSQAEAVIDIINSQNDFALKSAVKQLSGAVSEKIKTIRSQLIYELAYIE